MNSFFKNSLWSLSLLSMAGLTSCVSTDVIEPSQPKNELGDEITLRLSAPETFVTRADGSHKLRYTASVLTLVSGSDYDWSTIQRQEIIEDEQSENSMTFKVEPDKRYKILVVADYIPASYQPNSKGLYNDYYYDTQFSNNQDFIRMIPNPGGENGTLGNSFFNNDYYDCFSYTDTVHKSLLKKELDCKLSRAVAKIRFVDDSATAADFSNITFNWMSLYDYFTVGLQENNGDLFFNYKAMANVKLEEMSNPDEHELFFFYTMAGSKNSDIKFINRDIEFTAANKQGGSQTIHVNGLVIPIQKNFITTVKGRIFPPSSQGTEPDPGPGTDPEPDPGEGDKAEFGDLILYMSKNNDWETGQTVSP